MESLRDDTSQATRPEPVVAAKPAQAAFDWFSARGPEAPRDKAHEVVSLSAKSGKAGPQGQPEQERLPDKRGWGGLGLVH
jgi:hypothetical protein